MTWKPTVNRFQAVLRKDGSIQMSYNEVAAQDAIVGLYPMVTTGAEVEIASVAGEENASVPAHLDIKSVKLAAVDGLFLKATIETRGALPPESNPGMEGAAYRVCLSRRKLVGDCTQNAQADVVWAVQMGGAGRRGSAGASRYYASGSGVSPAVKIEGNTISVDGTLPEDWKAGEPIFVSAAVQTPGTPPVTVKRILPHAVKLAGLGSPAVDLSTVKKQDGPFAVVYEAFHYMKPPRAMDLTCTVIKALGDKFDMLAYYSDFRIDNPEAGTSSNGPLGGGPTGVPSRGSEPTKETWKVTARKAGFSGNSSNPCTWAPIRCRNTRPKELRKPTRTTWRHIPINSPNGHPTERYRRMTMPCRRSATKWAIAGRPLSPPRWALRPSSWGQRTGRAACRLRWPSPIKGLPRHRRWGAECGRAIRN